MFAKSLLVAGILAAAAVNAMPTNDYGSSSSSGYGSSGSSYNSGYGSSDSSSSSGYGSSNSGYGSSSSGSMSGCSSGDCGSSGDMSSMSMESMSMESGCGSSGCGAMTQSSDCGSSGCGQATSSAMMSESTMMSESVMMSESMMMSESTSMVESTSTAMASMSYSTPSYGSGGMSWGSSGYDGCVQQCIAQFGAAGSYQPTATSGSEGSSGSGSTITVVVAPTQGVLRYVPFAVNASVGDTIKFMWGANNHTVTKSSELTPCNKTSDALFASGTHDKSFVFTQVVNDTNPTFFYCATPGHCGKGMFGIINPPSALDAPTSVAQMMPAVMANDTNLATYATYTANQTAGSKTAANWGSNIDMASIPDWAQSAVVENVMFTRNVLGMNPDLMNADGSVDLSSVSSTPMMVPADVGAALDSTSSTSGSGSGSSTGSSSASSSSASSSASPVGASSNGAMSVASSKVLVGATVLVATFFAL